MTMQPLLPVSVGIDPKLFETMSRELMTAEAQMKSIEEFVSENYSKSGPVSVGIDPKLFETMSRELMTAEAQMKSIEEFVSENYSKSEPTKRRHLSSRGIPTKNLPHKSSISKADYLIRVQSRHLQKIHNIGKSFETQQGYHPARQSRHHDKGGEKHRRLDPDNGQCVHDIASAKKYKERQCLRLAECAKNYNLYDLLVFFFGDDIDFNTGEIEESKITVSSDLLNIGTKVR